MARRAEPRDTLFYCKGKRVDIFQPGFPYVRVQFTRIGSLWWEGHLTQALIDQILAAGYECEVIV